MSVAEMRMLRWMSGHTRMDRIRNEVIRSKVGVAPIEDKVRENHLRWYGHVQRRSLDAPVRAWESIQIPSTRRVLMGITDPELYILDTFEDVEYERRTVEVSLKDSSENLLAHAYVWSNKDDPNLYGEWDFEEWKRLHMNDFVKMTMEFMEELDLAESKTRVATYESFFQQNGDNHPAS
ncbi:hypothetical protein L484_019880 [Morus notabilis]|uniref:Gamma-glutamylcyclotransferase AIG2-like domain-containing protein n=1 Tax=Morus notabilis TaxID=981085 RepID=W9SY61_9ROSA|nr:hypothetical protein L484_019880 [Morus notabilis]